MAPTYSTTLSDTMSDASSVITPGIESREIEGPISPSPVGEVLRSYAPPEPSVTDVQRSIPPAPVVPRPEALKAPTVKQALKEMALGMIPFYGKAYRYSKGAERQEAADVWKSQQSAANLEYQHEAQVLQHSLMKRMDSAVEEELSMGRMNYLNTNPAFSWMTPVQKWNASRGNNITETPRMPNKFHMVMPLNYQGKPLIATEKPDGMFSFVNPVDGKLVDAPPQAFEWIDRPPAETSMQMRAGMLNGQRAYGYFEPKTGKVLDATGADITAQFTPLPPQEAGYGFSIQPVEVPGKGQVLYAFDPRNPAKTAIPMTLPGGEQAVRKGELTAQTKGKVDQAWVIQNTGQDILHTIQSNPRLLQQIGSIAGRLTSMEAKIGNISPEARALYVKLKSFYSLQGLLHGWRAIRVSDEFEKAVGGIKQNPRALLAGVQALMSMSNTFLELGQGAGYAPAGGNVRYYNGDWYMRQDDGKWHKQTPQ